MGCHPLVLGQVEAALRRHAVWCETDLALPAHCIPAIVETVCGCSSRAARSRSAAAQQRVASIGGCGMFVPVIALAIALESGGVRIPSDDWSSLIARMGPMPDLP
eukprot:6457048-Pyramimonas_sp.AAC.1